MNVDKTLDPRSLCGITNCQNRAVHLIAWPQRLPVPFCTPCWTIIREQVATSGLRLTPRQWHEWLKQNAKPHILREAVKT